MKRAKDYYSKDKIIIYQTTLPDRILGILSTIGLVFIPILGLAIPIYETVEELLICIIILLAMIMNCVSFYSLAFKRYLCLDIENHKFIIREKLGSTREEFSTDDIMRIEVSGESSTLFSLDIVFAWRTYKYYGWSTGVGSLPIVGSKKMQRKRLEKFAEECNNILNQK